MKASPQHGLLETWQYKFRSPKGPGSFFILLLNLLVFNYQQNGIYNLIKFIISTERYPWLSGFLHAVLLDVLPKLFYPFLGWLADAKLGRYKVMQRSLWIMWVAAVLLLTASTLLYSFTSVYGFINGIQPLVVFLPVMMIIYFVGAIGTAGFHVNVIPFGIDQMEDGSAKEICSFLHWYYWTRNVNFGIIIQFAISSTSFYCHSNKVDQNAYDLVIALLQVTFITIAVCLDFLFSKNLNKDPKIHNPIQKVKEISTFIYRHNQPVGQRSAYTFTYDSPPARSDFAKKTYGGYFEEDDVEEVTSFWSIVLLMMTIGFGIFVLQSVSQCSIRIGAICIPYDT